MKEEKEIGPPSSYYVFLFLVSSSFETLQPLMLIITSEHVQSYVESATNNWTANQIWGFEVIDGKRRHVRHVVVRKADDWKQARLVYDWVGPAAAVGGTDGAGDEDDGLAYDG